MPIVHTTVPWLHGSVCDKHSVLLRQTESRFGSEPCELSGIGNCCSRRSGHTAQTAQSRIPSPTEVTCTYPKVSRHCASSDSSLTSVAASGGFGGQQSLIKVFKCGCIGRTELPEKPKVSTKYPKAFFRSYVQCPRGFEVRQIRFSVTPCIWRDTGFS